MLNCFFGTPCVRSGCGHRNAKDDQFCENCGISLGFSRPAILEGNRWSPAPDEVAAFFKFKAMQGFFTKTLHVPPGMRAWVLQGDNMDEQTLQLPEGEYTTETLAQRLNNFFRSPHGEVLVCRTDAQPVSLSYPHVLSADLLPMQAAATLHLQVGDVHAFRRRFMLQDGVVTIANLEELLRGPVRQVIADLVGAWHVDEMAADAQLRDKLDAALRSKLAPVLDNLGLALVQVTELSLHHEALDEQNEVSGRLWLLRRESQVQDAHDKALNQIYDQRQWEAIHQRERELRRREAEGDLGRQEADLVHTLRLRDVQQYERILQAQSREQAARLGAADTVADLEQQYAGKRRQREQQALGDRYHDESELDSWKHLQSLARIRLDGERRAAEVRAASLATFEAERVARELERIGIESQLQHARLLQDEAAREQAEQTLAQEEQERKGLLRDLARRQHEAVVANSHIALQAQRGDAARIQAWEDELLLSKIRKIRAEEDVAASDASVDTTRKWMLLNRQRELQKLEDKLQEGKLAFDRGQTAADADLVRELQRQAAQRSAEREQAEADRARLAVLGSLPEEVIVSLSASGANVDAIVELARIKAHKAMSADQIMAAQTGRGVQSPVPAAAMDGAFVKAMMGELGSLVSNLGQGQAARHDQESSNLMRVHEGSRSDLLEAMRILRDVSAGRPTSPVSAAVPAAAAPAQAPPVAPPAYAHAPRGAGPAWTGAQPVPSDKCHQCKAPADGYQHYCSRCGTELLPGRPPGRSAYAPAEGPGQHKCPRCGEWGAQAARYCWCCCHAFRS